MAPDMEKSDIVLSQQGRDKGRLLMVLDTDAEYLLLADGRRRRVERPKRKKIRHVSFVAKAAAKRAGGCARAKNCQTVKSAGRCVKKRRPPMQNNRGGNFVWQKKI